MFFIEDLLNILKKNKIDFFTGVPDSILKTLSTKLQKNKNHLIASNEGSAISIATGYHLSSKKIPCVYMQNSGLGNAINPLLSIAHKKVYSIPMLLIIGWRGSPGSKDEPQHEVTGKITRKLLKTLDIDFCVVDNARDFKLLNKLIIKSRKNSKPIACLIKNNSLKLKSKPKDQVDNKRSLFRYDIIKKLIQLIDKNTYIISTTGYTSRELNQLRKLENLKKGKDFYMIGGMGHSASVSLGFSLFKKKEKILCLDGDGSMLMHMGSLATVGVYGRNNFKHILFNNNSHESVGGQKTNSEKINFKNLSSSIGYKKYMCIDNKINLERKIIKFLRSRGPTFLEIKTKIGTLKNLKRPTNFLDIKKKFMNDKNGF